MHARVPGRVSTRRRRPCGPRTRATSSQPAAACCETWSVGAVARCVPEFQIKKELQKDKERKQENDEKEASKWWRRKEGQLCPVLALAFVLLFFFFSLHDVRDDFFFFFFFLSSFFRSFFLSLGGGGAPQVPYCRTSSDAAIILGPGPACMPRGHAPSTSLLVSCSQTAQGRTDDAKECGAHVHMHTHIFVAGSSSGGRAWRRQAAMSRDRSAEDGQQREMQNDDDDDDEETLGREGPFFFLAHSIISLSLSVFSKRVFFFYYYYYWLCCC